MRRILFCGSDSFSSTILARLTQSFLPATTFLTLIPPSSHIGRGLKKLYRPPLLELVEKLGIAHHSLPRSENPIIRRNPLKDWSLPEELNSPDSILLSASFPYWIPSKLIRAFAPLRALNVHPSLLPCYRGAAPIQWQLANQEPELGVSIQELSSVGFDRGVILAQKALPLPTTTCYPAAEHALANLAADLLLDLIPNIDAYINSAWPQDPAKASYAPKIVPLDLRIDPNWSYAKVAGRCRGMSHQYPLNIQINGEIYQIEVELSDSPMAARFAAQNGARLSGALPGELLFDRALDRVALRLGPPTSSGDCEPPLLINNAKLVRAGGKGWLKPAAWWDRLFNTSPGSPKSLKTFRIFIDPTSE